MKEKHIGEIDAEEQLVHAAILGQRVISNVKQQLYEANVAKNFIMKQIAVLEEMAEIAVLEKNSEAFYKIADSVRASSTPGDINLLTEQIKTQFCYTKNQLQVDRESLKTQLSEANQTVTQLTSSGQSACTGAAKKVKEKEEILKSYDAKAELVKVHRGVLSANEKSFPSMLQNALGDAKEQGFVATDEELENIRKHILEEPTDRVTSRRRRH